MQANVYLFTFIHVATSLTSPVLITHLVAHSKVNLDSKTYSKIPLIVSYILVNLAIIAISLFESFTPPVKIGWILDLFHTALVKNH